MDCTSFDGQVVRPTNPELRELYAQYVCVRVTDMRGVDLSRYRFDYGLTFAALLMHPDGTVYHRYGARDHRAADTWLSEASFAAVLRETLAEHRHYSRRPDPPEFAEPLRTEDVPAWKAKNFDGCIHCHNVRPALFADELASGSFDMDRAWFYPTPDKLGIEVTRDDQNRVAAVRPGGPAANAGVLPGDRITRAGDVGILTVSDLSYALDGFEPEGGRMLLVLDREGELVRAIVELEPGWKVATPLEYHWRPFKWELMPRAGFGGSDLSDDEKRELGVKTDELAFRITYFVKQGKRFMRAAQDAGLQKGDVVIGANGQYDFVGNDHFHTWWRFTHKPGDTVVVEYMRDGIVREAEIVVP